METGWTLASLAMVGLLFGLTVPAMRSSHPSRATGLQPDLTVVGHQWWWEVRYPGKPGQLVTANEVHLPVGQKLLVALESADVIHDFWVPQLGPKQDLIPGQTNYLWLEPSKVGVYDGACAEFCGNEHAWMRIRVIAESPADFALWQQRQRSAPAHSPRGEQVFAQYACASCHAISGQGARLGPDLTHVADRQTLGAGVLENSPANLALWLKDPQAIKPQCNMPSFNLSQQDVASLAAYLSDRPPPGGALERAPESPP